MIRFEDEQFVDGLIVPGQGAKIFPDNPRTLPQIGEFPVVVIGAGAWAKRFHTVDVDNEGLGSAAAAYLHDRGHRNVLVIGGESGSLSAQKRRQGFASAMNDRGVPVRPGDVFDAGYEPDDAYRVARTLFARPFDYTAAFCYNDNVALGLIRAAREAGISIPADLSIVGIDASNSLDFAALKLTSFRQSLEAMGNAAFDLIHERPETAQHLFFDFELREGDSVLPRGEQSPVNGGSQRK